jgi:predicted Zn-dependent protease
VRLSTQDHHRAGLPAHPGCGLCALRSRRLFTQGLLLSGLLAPAGAAVAQRAPEAAEDVGVSRDVGRSSRLAQLVPAEQLENQAAQQYLMLKNGYGARHALAPEDHPQSRRLRAIARRIIPYAPPWNERARQWRWEVSLLLSPELNAFCMPGGKIAFYTGILQKLQLDDDEVATVMGHEVAHALREHARERLGKRMATQGAIDLGSALLGLGHLGRSVAGAGGQLLTLKFSRDDETEADIVGMELAARAGYDPAAGLGLWRKMLAVSQGAPPQWLSTHPAGDARIREIQAKLPKVRPLFDRADKPQQRYGPPPAG